MVPALAPDPLPLGRTVAGRAEVRPLAEELLTGELFTDELPTHQFPALDFPAHSRPADELPTTVIPAVTGPRSAERASSPPSPPAPPSAPGLPGGGSPERRSRLPWIAGTLVAIIAVAVVMLVLLTRPKHSLGPVDTARSAAASAAAGASASSGTGQQSTSGPSGPSSASGPAQQQATAIAGYLNQTSAVRAGISAAIGSIGGCRDIAAAVSTLRQAADVRAGITSSLTPSQVSALPGGAAIRTELRQAMTASAEADRHYASWGEAVATSCAGQAAHTPEFAAAQRSDLVASAAKQRFVQSWNAVAPAFGFPPQTADSI